MSFSSRASRWMRRLERRSHQLYLNVCAAAHDSVQNGSVVTGAPGQPIQSGNLRVSWQMHPIAPTETKVSTRSEYARPIEDGIDYRTGKPLTLRSEVGGFHGRELTIAGFPLIVADEARKLRGGGT